MITVVETLYGSSYRYLPMVINKGSAQYKSWYKNLTATMAACLSLQIAQ